MKTTAIDLPATPENVMRGVEALTQFAREQDIPENAIHALMLCLEEAGSNIVNHAYERDATQTFRVMMSYDGGRFTIELRDHGPAFDPLQAAAPEFGDDPDTRGPGGLGINLIRHYSDAQHYAREGEENVFRITKHIVSH